MTDTKLHISSKSSYYHPSTFTGKERDEETGYGYFGACYMDLSTLHLSNLIGHGCDKYNPGKVTSWDHYHPNNSNKSWYPSISDQRNARYLQNKSYGSIQCTLHTCGESYRFDTLVYNRDYYPSEMTRLVPSRVLNSTW